jgi:hypothetical protein
MRRRYHNPETSNLARYGDWAPTSHDTKGLNLPDQQDWLVCPTMQTRDSGPTDRSNFAACQRLLEEVDPSGEDWENHRFGHWGPGWIEILIVRPSTAAAAKAEEVAERLASYGVLDEEALGATEVEESNEDWDNWAARDYKDALVRRFKHGFLSLDLDEVPDELLRELFDTTAKAIDEYWREDSSGMTINTAAVAYATDVEDILSLPGAMIEGSPASPNAPFPGWVVRALAQLRNRTADSNWEAQRLAAEDRNLEPRRRTESRSSRAESRERIRRTLRRPGPFASEEERRVARSTPKTVKGMRSLLGKIRPDRRGEYGSAFRHERNG